MVDVSVFEWIHPRPRREGGRGGRGEEERERGRGRGRGKGPCREKRNSTTLEFHPQAAMNSVINSTTRKYCSIALV